MTYFIKHPVSVFLIILLIGLIGAISLIRIPVEIHPESRAQMIQITAYWGSQTPETVQRVITMPLEEIAIQVRDVRSVKSTSGVGYSSVTLDFGPDIDLKYAYVELREKIASLQKSLPRDVAIDIEPYSENEDEAELKKSPFFVLELSGALPLNTIRRIAEEKVVPSIKGINGAGEVKLFGGSELYVKIDLDETKLERLNIHPDNIIKAIRSHVERRGLGAVHWKNRRIPLVFEQIPSNIQDIAHIPLSRSLSIGDVAHVSMHYEEPTTLSRHNYNPLVTIHIYKTAGINALTFSQDINAILKNIAHKIPNNLELRVVKDNADNLIRELNSLCVRAVVILSIVFLILFLLFRRFSLSLIILSTVFLSILSASILLYFIGYTINVVTLAGIALVFGMLVDNAVVVIDNIHRHELLGESHYASGLHGTVEVVQPMLAATGTTLFVFFALLLLKDRLGDYYRPLAFALGFSLLSSLILAVTLIPAIYVRFHRVKSFKILSGDGETPERFSKFTRLYGRFIRWSLRHRLILIAFFLVLFGISGYLFSQHVEKGGFYRWLSEEKITIWIETPRGVTLETLDNIVKGFEQRIRSADIPCDVQTVVNARQAYGKIQITFDDSLRNTIYPFLLKESLVVQAVNYAGVGISISGFGLPYYNGGYQITTYYNTFLQVTGPQYDKLHEICESILKIAKKDPRVGGSIISPSLRSLYFISNLKEITLETSLENLWKNGWTYRDVMNQLKLRINKKYFQSNIPIGKERMDIAITMGTDVPQLDDVLQADLITPGGRKYQIKNLFNSRRKPVSPWIDKEDQQYRFTLAWEYRGPERLRSRHEKNVVSNLSLPPGYHLVEREWGFLTKKEKKDLMKLIAIVIVGTFMILASLYESFGKPFIIFFSIPFSLTGVFFTYYLFEQDFNVNGYIGLILLTGIVVNNAIILVDRIKQLVENGLSITDAVVHGSMERIRPIMITTLTTIGGLIPLFLMSEGESFISGIMEELSFITVSGIVSSTILTITIIPILYYSMERMKMNFRKSLKGID